MIHPALLRWYGSFGSFGIPQAAAPIAFALVALPLTGDAGDGAAMVLSLMVAQLIGAVPIARLARRHNTVNYLKLLILIRALALAAVALLAASGAALIWLVVATGVAGLVNGAAYGLHRSVLNHLVAPGRLPRALGIAATINELVFVSAPILASALGAVNPVMAVAVLSLLGAAPLILLPRIPDAAAPPEAATAAKTRIITWPICLWLLCAAATYAAVAAVEIGAVAVAISFGFSPNLGFIFPVVLCIGSVAGGIWVSVRNRRASGRMVILYLGMTAFGSGLIAWNQSVILTMIGSIIAGYLLPLLATHYQLVLDELAPPHRRAEVFALLRNAGSIGLITISLTLTVWSLSVTLITAAIFILVATLTALAARIRESER